MLLNCKTGWKPSGGHVRSVLTWSVNKRWKRHKVDDIFVFSLHCSVMSQCSGEGFIKNWTFSPKWEDVRLWFDTRLKVSEAFQKHLFCYFPLENQPCSFLYFKSSLYITTLYHFATRRMKHPHPRVPRVDRAPYHHLTPQIRRQWDWVPGLNQVCGTVRLICSCATSAWGHGDGSLWLYLCINQKKELRAE